MKKNIQINYSSYNFSVEVYLVTDQVPETQALEVSRQIKQGFSSFFAKFLTLFDDFLKVLQHLSAHTPHRKIITVIWQKFGKK